MHPASGNQLEQATSTEAGRCKFARLIPCGSSSEAAQRGRQAEFEPSLQTEIRVGLASNISPLASKFWYMRRTAAKCVAIRKNHKASRDFWITLTKHDERMQMEYCEHLHVLSAAMLQSRRSDASA